MSHSPTTKDSLVPVDTGIIRCVCPSTEDDGFTIQCERCLVWQHAYCVHITHTTIPDHYLCDQCSKRKRPKMSKRIPISKRKLRRLDAEETVPNDNKNKRRKPVKIKVISRYVHSIFHEARERWTSSSRWKQHAHQEEVEEEEEEVVEIVENNFYPHRPLLCDHGSFVAMDATTLLTKGVLMDTPVSNQGLFATQSIPALRYLMEITGDVFLKSEFKFDPANHFIILGTPLSHIVFYPSLDLCIDTRQFGNKARYIRRSCHPNAELRNVIVPRSRDDKVIHLGLFARRLIEKGQEVTIGWNWQRGHISWKENMNWHHQHKQKKGNHHHHHQVIDEEEERKRKATIKVMLDRFEKEFGACACVNKRRCLIEHLKRQCASNEEKSAYNKRVSAVHILPNKGGGGGRRKSSIILLKPKPVLERLKAEENLKLNSSLFNTITNTTKDTSDDEVLDVEGDTDTDNHFSESVDNNTTPLLNDNMSEDENVDISSLSSLSSLSVFEESENEGNQQTNSEKSNPTTTPSLIPEKTSVPLPRKKLWMRNYLEKYNVEKSTEPSDVAPINMKEENEQQINTLQNNKDFSTEPNIEIEITSSDQNSQIDIVDEDNKRDSTLMEDVRVTDNDVSSQLIGEEKEKNEIKITHNERNNSTENSNLLFDTDDDDVDELSDASTILLDEEELRTVYHNRRNIMDNDSKATSFNDNKNNNDSLLLYEEAKTVVKKKISLQEYLSSRQQQ
ncbi:uncharacterized protein BX663DRAFT_493732 [Cokeromyces recurvatus]|uniref:uncharacterized protein n=1 Tax=Cokeromyces recurvatus TaxID=90255 RepID=UPI00221F358C|nr:uncharacterized protein BX663DRAFT_493732 [Cokeromyces recurvatus]KAI7908301.1 hypothetical protein BX663DRAFT_493732 [Cokeromyces recurvatus]